VIKLNWNNRVTAFVRMRLEALLASEPTDSPFDDVLIAREMQALPVYKDLGGTLGFNAEGTVLFLALDSEQVRPVIDHGWTIVAAVAASEKYPELRDILPERPPTAITCAMCLGAGKLVLTPKLTVGCATCWGLGWVESA
jgi:hypothetical protein